MFDLGIRCSAKALILHEGKLLLNRCVSRLGVYYALPGGGMHDDEVLGEAVVREVMEETGLTVEPIRMSAVYESINENHEGNVNAHKMYFVFLCRYVSNVPPRKPVERDAYQTGSEWLTLDQVREANLFPRVIRNNIKALLENSETLYLGSERRQSR